MVQQQQMSQSSSTPNVPTTALAASNLDERPATANRTPEGKTPAPLQAVLSPGSTPETLTPPIPSKRASDEAERCAGSLDDMAYDVDEEGYNGDGDTTFTLDDDDDDSDSDEGLTMTRRKPAAKLAMPRRGTNASVGSTDTAKKVVMDS